MKNNIIKYLVCTGMALGFAASVQAISITGGLHMTGVSTLDNQNLGLATKATAFASVLTQPLTATGSYAGIGTDSVTFKPFSWNPSSAPIAALWKFTDLGTTWVYQFDLGTITGVTQNSSFLNISGTGNLTITGAGSPYTTTLGAWTFTISNPGGGNSQSFNFGFDSANNALPDGGMTVMLLGAALSGLALIRRKLA
jgi:hypothetical protein